MKKLVLIDGHAILHRAFHALPPKIKHNAVYGFTTMLLRILKDLEPTYVITAFDLPQANFRQQIYTQYQGKRPEMEGNLSDQIPLAHQLLDALGVPYFEVGGFEADDVIGTLVAQSEIETIIVTGDRDMLQLVTDKVKVCVPVKGLSETKTYDEKLVFEEFGVKPVQWVDVKALKGDASDNYPGVTGVGPKTACDLIAKYGTLENLFGQLDKLVKLGELKEATAKKLAEGAEAAGLGKKLAQIVTDVPGVHLELEKARVEEIDWLRGVKFMREVLGFKSLPEKIEKSYINNDSDQMKLI